MVVPAVQLSFAATFIVIVAVPTHLIVAVLPEMEITLESLLLKVTVPPELEFAASLNGLNLELLMGEDG